MERGGKDEVQTCSMDESCQSGAVHGIPTLSPPKIDVCDGNFVGKTDGARGKRVGLSVGKRARVPRGYVQVLMMSK